MATGGDVRTVFHTSLAGTGTVCCRNGRVTLKGRSCRKKTIQLNPEGSSGG
jgi:hypothetical protein